MIGKYLAQADTPERAAKLGEIYWYLCKLPARDIELICMLAKVLAERQKEKDMEVKDEQ